MSVMIRPVIIGALFLAISLLPAGVGAAKKKASDPNKRVVATVGGKRITLDDYQAFIRRLPARIQAVAAARKMDLLESLIQRELIHRLALSKNLDTSPRIKAEMAILMREALIGEVIRLMREEAKPKESEVRAEYDKNRKKYTEGASVTAAHIMVASEKEAKGLLAKLAKGVKFDELARKYSLAPERSRGGSLGTMQRGQFRRTGLPEIIEKTAFSLKSGAHSGVVRSIYGWHVVRTSSVKAGKQMSFSKVKGRIGKEMSEKNRARIFRKRLADLAKKYPVKKFPEQLR